MDNLLNGEGLSWPDGVQDVPLTHFPPGYPLLVAFVSSIFRVAPVCAARVLGVLFYGAVIMVFGWLLWDVTRSNLVAWLGAFLCLSAPVMWSVNLLALSEPPFLVTCLLILWMVWRYNQTDKNNKYMPVMLGLLIGIAYLTRYAGIALAGFTIIAIMFWNRRHFIQRIRAVVIMGIVSLISVIPSLIRNYQLTGALTNRTLVTHFVTMKQIMKGLDTLTQWFLPYQMPINVRVAILAAVVIGWSWILKSLRKHNKSAETSQGNKAEYSFIILSISFVRVYLLMLLFSLSFFDASTRLNDRILSPVYIIGLLATVVMLRLFVVGKLGNATRWAVALLSMIFIGANVYSSGKTILDMRRNGQYITGKSWRNSETISLIRELPDDVSIYSNEAFPIYFLTGRKTNWIPELVDPVKNLSNATAEVELIAMRQELMSGDGVLIVFFTMWDVPPGIYPTADDLTYGLERRQVLADGAIYAIPGWEP